MKFRGLAWVITARIIVVKMGACVLSIKSLMFSALTGYPAM
jgi:hypothetical protein